MLQPLFILQQILEIYLMSNILDFTEKNLQKKMNLFEFLEIMFSLESSTNLLRYKRTRWKQSANVPNDSHATLEL